MLKKIIGALFLGSIATVYMLQNDYEVKEFVARNITSGFAQMFKSNLQARVKCISFFSPAIELEDMMVSPIVGDEWSWSCKKYLGYFSWWQLLHTGVLELHVVIEDFKLHSNIEHNDLAVREHIEQLIATPAPPIPMVIKSITLKHVTGILHEQKTDTHVSFSFSSNTQWLHNTLHTSAVLHDGWVRGKEQTFFEQLSGTCTATIVPEQIKQSVVNIDTQCVLPHLSQDQSRCFAIGAFEHEHGKFTIQNGDCSLHCPVKVDMRDEHNSVTAQAKIPLSYGGSFVQHIRISCHKTDNIYAGKLQGQILSAIGIEGVWEWDNLLKKGSGIITHTTLIMGPASWSIPAQQGTCTVAYQEGIFDGMYKALVQNLATDEQIPLVGTISGSMHKLAITGTCCNDYHTKLTVLPLSYTLQAQITDSKKTVLATAVANFKAPYHCKATIQYPFMRSCMRNFFSYDVQGEGEIVFSGMVDDNNIVHMNGSFEKGALRIPYTYNFIDRIQAQAIYRPVERTLIFSKATCDLHKGTIVCNSGHIYFDHAYRPSHFYIPVLCDNCLFNFQKDFFAILSGSLYVTGTLAKPLLKGHLFLEHSQLKTTIFSKELQKKLFGLVGPTGTMPSVSLTTDIALETKEPMRIKTDLLDTNARVALTITNSILNPEVSGFIALTSGILSFPYRPLYISHGKITFTPGQLKNPYIELIAKNRIKKYNVTMHSMGSLEQNFIDLESTPALTKEQIIGLLCTGCAEESLAIVMPALLMHNIKNVLIESGHRWLEQDNYLKYMFAPLRYVHLVPLFNDQRARGGLRGAIEIDVSDRWRGLIQKNFSLTEDTRFEAEYFLSDHVSIRGFRNERKDIGGDVQVRWKF